MPFSCESCGRRLVGRRRFCSEHRPSSRARKSTNDRDYGQAHQALRARYAEAMRAGAFFNCPYCDEIVHAGTEWDLDHTDDRRGYNGPAHRSCNRREAARKKNRLYPRRGA